MADPDSKPVTDAESAQTLAHKIHDYHKQGGAQSTQANAKQLEAEIGQTQLAQEEELKKGRPRSSPAVE